MDHFWITTLEPNPPSPLPSVWIKNDRITYPINPPPACRTLRQQEVNKKRQGKKYSIHAPNMVLGLKSGLPLGFVVTLFQFLVCDDDFSSLMLARLMPH